MFLYFRIQSVYRPFRTRIERSHVRPLRRNAAVFENRIFRFFALSDPQQRSVATWQIYIFFLTYGFRGKSDRPPRPLPLILFLARTRTFT